MRKVTAPVALVTNSIVPYCYDVAKLLALPTGLPYRFRYLKKWLSSNFPVGQLKGRDAVIVLRIFDTAQLIPVRFAKIMDVLVFGEIVHIEFFVEKYVAVEESGVVVKGMENALAGIQVQNIKKQDLAPLVFSIGNNRKRNESNKLCESENTDWDRIVSELGTLEAFSNYSFFKILSIKDSKGSEVSFVDDEVRGKKAYSVRPVKLYFVELLQKMPWNIDKSESIAKEFVVKLSCYDDGVTVKQAYQKVVGKYDLLRFSFRSALTHTKRYSSLFLDIPQTEPPHLDESIAYLPLVLTPGSRERCFRWIKIICGIMGIIGMGGADEVAQLIGWTPNIARAASIFLIVVATGKWEELLIGYLDKASEIKL